MRSVFPDLNRRDKHNCMPPHNVLLIKSEITSALSVLLAFPDDFISSELKQISSIVANECWEGLEWIKRSWTILFRSHYVSYRPQTYPSPSRHSLNFVLSFSLSVALSFQMDIFAALKVLIVSVGSWKLHVEAFWHVSSHLLARVRFSSYSPVFRSSLLLSLGSGCIWTQKATDWTTYESLMARKPSVGVKFRLCVCSNWMWWWRFPYRCPLSHPFNPFHCEYVKLTFWPVYPFTRPIQLIDIK